MVYGEVQNSRVDHALPLPAVIKNEFSIVDGPASSAAGNPGCILSLFVSICVSNYVSCYECMCDCIFVRVWISCGLRCIVELVRFVA